MQDMVILLQIYIVVGCLHIAKANVNLTLTSNFISSNRGYLLVNGEQMVMECSYAFATEINWIMNQKPLLVYSPATNITGVGSGFDNKVVTHTYSANKHSLVLNVDKSTDEGSTVICAVKTSPFKPAETGQVKLKDILVPPSGVTLSTGVIVSGTQTSIQCVVNSVYKGKDDTEFKLRVGDSYMTSGTKTETSGSVTGTYTVTYTQAVTLAYIDHQDQQVQCEVVWKKGTSVETKKTSTVQVLDIYYKATYVTLDVSETAVEEGSSVTFTCSTSSNPSPRLRLYRQREGQATSLVKTVTGVTLSWTDNVTPVDNKAEFYCRTDENKNIDGWNFDVLSDFQQLNVWYKPSLTCDAHSKPDPTEGDTRQIECTSTSANPEPVLSMYRGDVVVKTVAGRTLTYSVDITREINGVQFKCMATSSDTTKYDYSVTSDWKSYNVFFPPLTNTLGSEASFTVITGNDIALSCTTGSSYPVSEIVWETAGSEEIIVGTSADGEYGGKVVESTYAFTPQRSDNGVEVSCTPKWKEDLLTALKKTVTLNILYPPEVSVQRVSSPIYEGSQTVITCNIEVGNPENITTQYWEFEPKYPDAKSQAIVEQVQKRELKIDKTMYSDAGTYRCTAGNAVGNHTGEIQIVVHYDPKLLASDTTDIIYSDLYDRAVLTVAVRAFPGFDNVQSAFAWTRSTGGELNNALVTSTAHSHDIFLSKMVIDPVDAGHYGQYTITVNNKIKAPLTISLELRPRGPPKPVSEVTILAVAAEQILISFRVGANGGSQQIFHIVVRETDANKETEINTDYVDPSKDSVLNFTIQKLQPETKYIARVISSNFYGEQSSDFFQFTTRAKPVVDEHYLKVHIDNTAVLSWKYDVQDISVTTVVIEQCLSDTHCLEHNVTTNTEQMLELSVSDGDIFFLVIYQDGLETYRSQPFSQLSEDNQLPVMAKPEAQGSVPIGGIVGGIMAAITLIIIAVGSSIWFCKRKGSQKQDSNAAISEIPVYINMKPNDSPYQDLENKDVSETTVYQELNKN